MHKSDIKYFAYFRKSSESEDRQVQSIEAQKREVELLAKRLGLNVVAYFEESQSAKQPGRPKFTEMMERLSAGEANGIVVWKLNRLARNPIDGGAITWALQNNTIESIVTHSHTYLPTDNVLMMQVEFGMANQYVRDLSNDTKRGLRERIKRGYPIGTAPIGYRNDLSKEPGNRGWLIDDERFELVQEALNLYANGVLTARELLHTMNHDWKLTTPVRKTLGGHPISRSYLYHLLANPVYAGFFYDREGQRHELNQEVPRMVSEETHLKILARLGGSSHPRNFKIENIFAEYGQCGECGCPLVRERKSRVRCDCGFKFSNITRDACPKCELKIDQMQKARHYSFDYLHCTRTAKDHRCKQPVTQYESFSVEISDYLERNLNLTPELAQWCLQYISELDEKELKVLESTNTSRSFALERAETKYQRLLEDRISRDLSREQLNRYDRLEAILLEEIENLKQDGDPHKEIKERYRRLERDFNLATEVAEIFKNGSNKERKEILAALNSKLVLVNKKLEFKPRKDLAALIATMQAYRELTCSFETKKPLDLQEVSGGSDPEIFPLLRR